jgi:uncharacterized glyoxalase superfamily protein PhnB
MNLYLSFMLVDRFGVPWLINGGASPQSRG